MCSLLKEDVYYIRTYKLALITLLIYQCLMQHEANGRLEGPHLSSRTIQLHRKLYAVLTNYNAVTN